MARESSEILLLNVAKKRQKTMLQDLQSLVEIESPSDNKVAVDCAAMHTAAMFAAIGGNTRWHRQKQYGDLLEIRFAASAAQKKAPGILLLGHLDTVWPMGTLATMPFRLKKDRAFGPGVYDMKTGIIMAAHAMAMLRELGRSHPAVTVLLNSDEEIGSPCSRAVTEQLARNCAAVFVLEPAQGIPGAYKTARKGVGEYRLHVQGVASHSGVDFEKGHSATLELARQLEKISGFTDLKTGLTMNPGVIGGGTHANVVAAEAYAEIDVRIARMHDAARLAKMFQRLRPVDPACKLEISGGINRPPMERSADTVKLFRRAKKFASAMGFSLSEASTGGGSDGNFTAALGIPTLDGMGAVGEGAHARHESILLKDLAPRTALLAAIITHYEA